MTRVGLINEVFKCMRCEGTSLPFRRCSTEKFYRFPPVIGASTAAPLLFIGISPRVSKSNQALHDSIVANRRAFGALSKNRDGKGAYIARMGPEPHYYLHVDVASRLFPGVPFEFAAACTELYFCASEDSRGFPRDSSRCAEHYLDRVLELASPLVVFAIGRQVERTLQARARSWIGELSVSWPTGRAPVLTLPHPNAPYPEAWGSKEEAIRLAVEAARRHLRKLRSPAEGRT